MVTRKTSPPSPQTPSCLHPAPYPQRESAVGSKCLAHASGYQTTPPNSPHQERCGAPPLLRSSYTVLAWGCAATPGTKQPHPIGRAQIANSKTSPPSPRTPSCLHPAPFTQNRIHLSVSKIPWQRNFTNPGLISEQIRFRNRFFQILKVTRQLFQLLTQDSSGMLYPFPGIFRCHVQLTRDLTVG